VWVWNRGREREMGTEGGNEGEEHTMVTQGHIEGWIDCKGGGDR
jgi:hypothetical protein